MLYCVALARENMQDGGTPAMSAAVHGNAEAIRALVAFGAELNTQVPCIVPRAAKRRATLSCNTLRDPECPRVPSRTLEYQEGQKSAL